MLGRKFSILQSFLNVSALSGAKMAKFCQLFQSGHCEKYGNFHGDLGD